MSRLFNTIEKVEKILRQECYVSDNIKVYPHTSVTRDLGIDTDDISFYFIPALHKEFNKKLSSKKWSELETVEQIARAFSEE